MENINFMSTGGAVQPPGSVNSGTPATTVTRIQLTPTERLLQQMSTALTGQSHERQQDVSMQIYRMALSREAPSTSPFSARAMPPTAPRPVSATVPPTALRPTSATAPLTVIPIVSSTGPRTLLPEEQRIQQVCKEFAGQSLATQQDMARQIFSMALSNKNAPPAPGQWTNEYQRAAHALTKLRIRTTIVETPSLAQSIMQAVNEKVQGVPNMSRVRLNRMVSDELDRVVEAYASSPPFSSLLMPQ